MVLIMKTSFPLTTGWVWASSLLGGFDASRQADVSLYTSTQREVASRPSTMLARSPQTPREATRPERHQCLGVHNNATLALSQPFVSATLALRELLSISRRVWRHSFSPSITTSSLQRMDHFPACFPDCLSAWLPLSSAGCRPRALQSSPCACCNYPLHRHTSPETLVGNFFFLCSGATGIDCDGQRPVNDPFVHCSSIKQHVWPPENDVWRTKICCQTPRTQYRLWRRLIFEQNIFARFKPLDIPAVVFF